MDQFFGIWHTSAIRSYPWRFGAVLCGGTPQGALHNLENGINWDACFDYDQRKLCLSIHVEFPHFLFADNGLIYPTSALFDLSVPMLEAEIPAVHTVSPPFL